MANRIVGGLITLLISGAATLPLAGVAHADEAEAVSGECSATLLDENGEPLSVDADALVGDLGDLGVPAVRLGTPTEREARKAQAPAVVVPVGDVVEGLGLADAPVLGDAADAVCGAVDGAAATVNRVGQTAQSAVSLDQTAGLPDVVQPIDPEPVDEGSPAPNPGVVAPVVDEVPAGARPPLGRFEYFGFERFPAGPLPKLALPDAAAQNGPELKIGGRSDDLAASNAGHAMALPEAPIQQPQRAPFVLAVGLLAVVAAVLVRRWVTRAVR